jgi:hypothetical protein
MQKHFALRQIKWLNGTVLFLRDISAYSSGRLPSIFVGQVLVLKPFLMVIVLMENEEERNV